MSRARFVILAVVYAPFLYLENLLLRDSLIVLATLGLVLVAEWVRANPRRERALGFGFASGLAILLKSHFALFLAGMMVIVAAGARRDRRRAAALVLVMAAGAAIALTLRGETRNAVRALGSARTRGKRTDSISVSVLVHNRR